MLALVAASLLANTPLECAQAFWKAHCTLERNTYGKSGRKKWEQALAQLATYDFQVYLLGDHSAEPVEESQDSMSCIGERTFTARVTEQTPATAKAVIAAGWPGSLADTVELSLVLEQGAWRVDDNLPVGSQREPRKPQQPPADLAKVPAERALALYALYLPVATMLDAYPYPRRAEVMLQLRSYVTRPLMMRLLTGPHPGEAGWADELVCFAPSLNGDGKVEPELAVTGGPATVTVSQRRADGGTGGPAQLHFVKQDVWRLEKVTCPAGRTGPKLPE